MKWNRAKGRKDRHVIDARGSSPSSGSSGGGGLRWTPDSDQRRGARGRRGVVVVIVIVAIQVLGGGEGGGGFDLGPAFGSERQPRRAAEPGRRSRPTRTRSAT